MTILYRQKNLRLIFNDGNSNFYIADGGTHGAGVSKAAAESNVCRCPGCTYGDDAPLTVIYACETVCKGRSIVKDTLHCLIVIIEHTTQGVDVKFKF